MAKKKKGKVVPLKPALLSAENYIKTQARSLPIAECWITKDWQSVGMCNVIVARRHKNENTTLGIYLVDLYCLGLKDADYEFNVSPADYKRVKQHSGQIELCDYVLAHNIIYGAMAFAEDYGFKPHKDFAIAQFILEEDDDHVELMDLEFGMNGEPFYTRGPNDNNAKINMIRSTLLRTAGEGNFTIIDSIDDRDWEDDSELEDDNDEWEDNDIGEDDDSQNADFFDSVKEAVMDYDRLVRTDEQRMALLNSTIGKSYVLTEQPVENYYRKFDDDKQEDHYDKLLEMVSSGERDEAIKGINEAIAQYPGKAQFYNLLQTSYYLNKEYEKSDEIIVEMFERFPGYLFALFNYINLLLSKDQTEEVISIINGYRDLNDMYPDRKQFSRHEAAIFYATFCIYFTVTNDLTSADIYLDAMLRNNLQDVAGQTIVRFAMMKAVEAMRAKMKDKEMFN